jgi:hypothetical protein
MQMDVFVTTTQPEGRVGTHYALNSLFQSRATLFISNAKPQTYGSECGMRTGLS